MTQRNLFFASGGVFLLFVIFSYFVHKNHFTQFDFDMTVRLQDHISRRFDGFFSFLSDIGRVETVTVVLLLVWLIYRKIRYAIVFVTYGIFHLFEIYGKTFVSHLPPPHFMLRTQNLFNFPAYYVQLQNSYPSGHAARAFFITTILGFLVYKAKKFTPTIKYTCYLLLVIYDLLMITSRVYLGEHWTSDVIGGSLLGLSFALVSVAFF